MRLSRAWDEQIFSCKPALVPGREPQAGPVGWFCPWCKAESGSPCPELAQVLGLHLVTHGARSLVTQPHFFGPHQAPQSIPQPTQSARLAVLGMETSSSSLGEGKDTRCLVLRAPRSGQTMESMDGDWCRRG